MKTLTIGKLAKRVGVNVETIRFYERKGIILKPQSSASGYRQYSEKVVERLIFVRQAKLLGFSLKEIVKILQLFEKGQADCQQFAPMVDLKLEEIEKKIQFLVEIKRRLLNLDEECRSSKHGCTIQNLQTQGEKDGNTQ